LFLQQFVALLMKVPQRQRSCSCSSGHASLAGFWQCPAQHRENAELTLANADLNNGSISGVTSTSGRFAVSPSNGTINRSSSWNATVTFTPTAFGVVADTLLFSGAVAGGVLKIPVTGRSPVPVLTSSVTELNFGDVDLAVPKLLQFTLSNATVNPLEIDAIANTHPQYFVEPASGIIAPNGSLVVSVIFAPTAKVIVRDTIQIISNAAVSPVRIPMYGRGGSPTDVVTSGEDVPSVFALDQNYPNPFNPTTEIPFALPRGEHVVVQVFDVLGEEIATVVDGWREAGVHRASFDATRLPSGMYVYRMRAGEFSAARKMMLVK
jgi:hypothetical protein